MRIRPDVELANLTDVGCRRENNEDYYAYAEPADEAEFQRRGRLIVIADGMGGNNAGQVASGIAVQTVREVFLNGAASDPQSILAEGFSLAQANILAHAATDPQLDGMGTTCTAAVLHQGHLSYGHIGDTRLYLIRGGHALQLTDDHSFVGRLVKAGVITPQQAATHNQRNVLTAALGLKPSGTLADFSGTPIPLLPGDVLLLSSDGLHGLVTDAEIENAAFTQSPYQACRTLLALATERGGPDNITVQVLRIVEAA